MKFTIFTGCYNSEPYIQRVFDSIESQTYKHFEWIIIDDCSKDNTVSVLKDFISAHSQYEIKLIVNEKNLGVAINRKHAIMMATGDFFVTWDHDDVAIPSQLQKYNDAWTEYGNDKVANIFSMCKDQHGKLYGKAFPASITVGNYLDYYQEYFMGGKVPQEKHVCTRVDVLRQFIAKTFPESNSYRDGDVLWASIALQYNSIMLNEALRIYFNDIGNINNMSSFTRSQKAGTIYITKLIWINHFLIRLKSPMLKMRYWFAVVFYGFVAGKDLRSIIKDIKSVFSKVMVGILAIPAKLMIAYMKLRGHGL